MIIVLKEDVAAFSVVSMMTHMVLVGVWS